MTPEEACAYKRFFRTAHNAEVVADYLNRYSEKLEEERTLYVYACPVKGCFGFHLTHSEQAIESNERSPDGRDEVL